MSRIICFSNHIIPSKDKHHAESLLDYIATRDGVEMNREKKMTQQELIEAIIQSNPEVIQVCSTEYDKYIETGNKFLASKFITASMEYITSLSESPDIYLKYISNRPGVIKNENMNHGLFNQEGFADLKLERENLQKKIEKDPNAPIWNHIISLTREDAVKFGYDNQEAWKQLLQSQMPQIANDMHIDLKNLVWNAAFHDEGHHPHVHIQVYSKDPNQGYVSVYTLEKIKSRLANQIFKQELDVLKTQRTNLRNLFEFEMKKAIIDYNKRIQSPLSKDSQIDYLDTKETFAKVVKNYTYKYQKKDVKNELKEILASITEVPNVRQAIDDAFENFRQFELYYKDDPEKLTTIEQFENNLLDGRIGERYVIHNFLINTLTNKEVEIKEPTVKQLTEEQLVTLQKSKIQSVSTLSKMTNKKYKIDEHKNAISNLTKNLIDKELVTLVSDQYSLKKLEKKTKKNVLLFALHSDLLKKQYSTYCSAKAQLLNISKEEVINKIHAGELGQELYKSTEILIGKVFKAAKQERVNAAVKKLEQLPVDKSYIQLSVKALLYAEVDHTEIQTRMMNYLNKAYKNPIEQYNLYTNAIKNIVLENKGLDKIKLTDEETKTLYDILYAGADPELKKKKQERVRFAVEKLLLEDFQKDKFKLLLKSLFYVETPQTLIQDKIFNYLKSDDSQDAFQKYYFYRNTAKEILNEYGKIEKVSLTKEETNQLYEIGYAGIDYSFAKKLRSDKQERILTVIKNLEMKSFNYENVHLFTKGLLYAEVPFKEIQDRLMTYMISKGNLDPYDAYYMYKSTAKNILIEEPNVRKIKLSEEETLALYKQTHTPQQKNVNKAIVIDFLYLISRTIEQSEKDTERNIQKQQRNKSLRNQKTRNRKRGMSYA